MRLIITGGHGQLGTTFAAIGTTECKHEIIALGRDELDILDHHKTRSVIHYYRPDAVVHTAAIIDPDIAVLKSDATWQLNVVASGNIAAVCQSIQAKLVYISTDYVYDGCSTGFYRETAATNPINHYGYCKLAGEQASFDFCRQAFAVRIGLLYGNKLNVINKAVIAARAGETIRAVTDQICSPTYTFDLAEAVLNLLASDKFGVYHIANQGCTSRYGLICETLRLAGIDASVKPLTADELSRPAKRPANTALDCQKLTTACGYKMRPWQDALQEYLLKLAL